LLKAYLAKLKENSQAFLCLRRCAVSPGIDLVEIMLNIIYPSTIAGAHQLQAEVLESHNVIDCSISLTNIYA